MQATSVDFRIYPSNALELLAGLLAAELRQPTGDSILTPEIVLIPQVAMRRWLQATLADVHGVAANLEFLTPGEFVARTLEANIGKTQSELDADTLHWHLYAALTDPAVLDIPALAQLKHYLADGDALKPWALAAELASVFEKYQAWRRDWLLRWEAGADPEDPQAVLWRHVASGHDYRARRIQNYLSRFEHSALPQGLPKRVFAFATLNISPDVLRVLATQARVGTLHFYLPTPSQGYWGDLQTLGARRRARNDDLLDESLFEGSVGENTLLQAWGAAGRDFMAMLGSYEVVHPSAEIDVYADPLASDQQPMSNGGLGDTLLRRLQSDLLHRVGPAAPAPLNALNAQDPSLQVHACHTCLRELQVLHDQLRGLLEDQRFDPPLQPREIAVLAPNIDPYIPYLEAVFSGSGDVQGTRIPYALADTSPLAGEPLTEVFIRLLDLPISRFGLNEILDLLASPPLAEASGLDAVAFEHLHNWLQHAGARWGVNAAHRVQHGAPKDDAYTWAFALDRLLLGYASGSTDDIAGVAPYVTLEGSALDALDTLIRLLQVLARYQNTLSEVLSPAQWRERLLGLLQALLPEEPSSQATQRALERLRTLIHQFADQSGRSNFDGTVAAEVIRAHFAGVLAEADTRAPLLTGGISIGRMVPMRLLPFRVICLLGMNDGDFPRRDPAAGLNQLTAEIGSEKRRIGDRSTREDDRFLFLQLFSSAQDVFYLSYLGADARDGSVREPSVLVSELINAAAELHTESPAAAKALTVRHTLQPFAPAAFGAEGDVRQFSYRNQWLPASARISGKRVDITPWISVSLPAWEDEESSLSIDALRRFFITPAEQFLRQRLDIRLTDIAEVGDDVEPLLTPRHGLDKALLHQHIYEALLAGNDADLYEKLRARALLPSGPVGRKQLMVLQKEIAPYAEAFNHWCDGAERTTLPVEVSLSGMRLHGKLDRLYAHGLAHVRLGAMNGPAAIRHGLDWLIACAAGLEVPMVRFFETKGAGIGPFIREPITSAQARAALSRLLELRRQGLQAPLPFGPYSGWEYFSESNAEKATKAAASKWYGTARTWGEGSGDAYQLALRGQDVFAKPALLQQFAETSFTVFAAVECGDIHQGFDDGRSFTTDVEVEA